MLRRLPLLLPALLDCLMELAVAGVLSPVAAATESVSVDDVGDVALWFVCKDESWL